MRVCVVGTGYVGLVSGACLADLGHHVTCVDIDAMKVGRINRGDTPIFEAGLDDILKRNVGTRLSATTNLREAFREAQVTLICVGTPFDGTRIDLSYVRAVATEIGQLLRERPDYTVVAVKSTVIPGTTDGIVRTLLEESSGKKVGTDFGLGMVPEFLAEGVAVRDFMHPDRIVVGGIDARAVEVLIGLFAAFKSTPMLRTDLRTAETIKYASNALLATLISYSNELARYCEAIGGVDAADVLPGVHLMKHLTYRNGAGQATPVSAASFLWSGCGFGGSCFPKDVRALVAHSTHHGAEPSLLSAVMEVNDGQPKRMIDLLTSAFPNVENKAVTVLGLAFKPGTDDVRESPALQIVAELVSRGASVTCHDPIAIDNAKRALGDRNVPLEGVRFEADLKAALSGSHAVLLITSWPEYAGLSAMLAALQPAPLLIDGRRFIAKSSYARYMGIGIRPSDMTRDSANRTGEGSSDNKQLLET